MKITSISLLLLLTALPAFSQAAYIKEKLTLTNMLNGRDSIDLRAAVFAVENAYYNGGLNKGAFDRLIERYAQLCRNIANSGNIVYIGRDEKTWLKPDETDTRAALAQSATFAFMTDSIPMQLNDSIIYHPPYTYNYDDYAGQREWSSMFVSTLMQTQKGNCHSMPLLYKLIMDELGEKCWLTLAPNHLYIKAWNKRTGWYNIELTCGDYPTDAWLMASGYVHMDAIRNGVYMDTLSVKQSVALCLTDLAQGYMRKYDTADNLFVLDCVETVLLHYPDYINALLIKADILARRYREEETPQAKEELDRLYAHIHQLGYRSMPKEMYLKWLSSLKDEYSERNRIRRIMTTFEKE